MVFLRSYKSKNPAHSWLRLAMLAVLSLCLSQGLRAQETYDVTDLGSLGPSGGSMAMGINDVGDVVGFADAPDGSGIHAFLWRKGKMADLATLSGLGSSALAVNDSGEVAGAAELSQSQEVRLLCQEVSLSGTQVCRAVFWEKSALNSPRDLGTLGGAVAVAFGINDNHVVVGGSDTADSLHAFAWRQGVLTDLGTPLGIDSAAHAINNRGQIAMDAHISRIENPLIGEPDYHGFLWDRGAFVDLGTLGGSVSFALALNSHAQVVGYASRAGDQAFDAFLWDRGVMHDLGVLPGDFFAEANGINEQGEVVGTSFGLLPRAFLWREGQMIDLNTLISPESGWQLGLAQAINNHGQIVGGGTHNGAGHAFLLTPRAR